MLTGLFKIIRIEFNACSLVQCVQFVIVIATDRNVGQSYEMSLFWPQAQVSNKKADQNQL